MNVIAITGASGAIWGIRLIEELLNAGEDVGAVVSEPGWQIIEHELGFKKSESDPLRKILSSRGIANQADRFSEFANTDFFAPFASGSAQFDAVVVAPCSMKTLSAVSHGYADSLITRICDVALKEKRRCILVVRETPLSLIHLQNMLDAARAGAEIVPPIPGFYAKPESVDDIINFVVGKILNLLGKNHTLFKRWGSK